jgi:outer membrane receptor protein involved in Fe transport
MKSTHLTLSLIAAMTCGTMLHAEEVDLDPIVVGADFRSEKLSQTAASVTVIGEKELYDKVTEPFAEVVGTTPNVNFSAGASRAKYIQIRGIGERGQFETPVNPSVGLIIDGIDFSNVPLSASLFDVKQIEVLRGPQGTTFGANALAGVINVKTNEPTNEAGGHLEATIGNYNTRAFGMALNAPIIENKLLSRFSIYSNKSDGYITNSYLNRDDTNNIDELTAKGKLKWFVSENHVIDLTYMHIDIDNGYDAFNRFNTRTTESDQPGKDTQNTDAIALRSTYQVNRDYHVVTSLSYSDSDLEYSYDEDWTDGWNYGGWDSTDQYLRQKKQFDVDLRLVSDEDGKLFNGTTAWTIGAYYRDYSSDLIRNYTWLTDPFKSYYDAESIAVYGQLDIEFAPQWLLVTGLRLEQWKTDYHDSDNITYNDTENLVGGKIGLEYHASSTDLYYLTFSRGYKPGGFNPVPDSSILPKRYDTETLWNIDLGVNGTYMQGKLHNRLNLFYGKRADQQVGTYYVYPTTYRFSDYIFNAQKGTYYGLEESLDYTVNENLLLFASLGLLKAEFDEFRNPVDGTVKDGRAPAQSPEYQYSIGLDYTLLENWRFKTSVDGRGSYYFSNGHDEKSDPYALWNASIEYMAGSWSAVLWGRNLTDTDYQTRGYFFDNGFPEGESLYTQQGDPLTFGFTLSYDF